MIWQTVRRKLFRMLSFFYPIIYMKYLREEVIYASAMIAAVAVVIESARFYSDKLKDLAGKLFSGIGKGEEVYRISGITYMALGALFTVIFFPRVIAVPVLACAILGDAVSSLASYRWKKVRVFRNKSLEGMLACFAVCLAAGWFFTLTGLSLEGFGMKNALIIALLTCLFDSLPLPLDDNISTPLAVGFLAQFLLA